MNGRTHAVIGAASVAGAASLGVSLLDCVPLAVIAAGFALGPDIDHPGSTISKSMPKFVHKIVHALCRVARTATAAGRDRSHFAWKKRQGHDPEHRTLTHTLVSGAVVAGIAWQAALLPYGTAVMAVLAAWWCRKLAGGLWLVMVAGAGVALFTPVDPVLVAWAAGAGWISHIIADGCTKAGVPLLWPIPIGGYRWYRFKLLGKMLASGDKKEWIAAFFVATLMNTPLVLL